MQSITFWSFECFTSTLSCQMDPNGTSSPFRAAKCKAVQPLMGSRWAQQALRFRSSRSSWTWPSALQIRKVMGKKPGETSGDGLETSEACDFKTKFMSSVYFQECIILRVNHVTKKWTVKESFRSRPKKHHKMIDTVLRSTVSGPLEMLWLVPNLLFPNKCAEMWI